MTAKQLRERLAKLINESRAIVDKADEEGRDLTAEDREQIDRIHSQAEGINTQIESLERQERLEAAMSQAPSCAVIPAGDAGDDGAMSAADETTRALALGAWCLTGSQRTAPLVTDRHREAMAACGLSQYIGDLSLNLGTFLGEPTADPQSRITQAMNALSVASPPGGGYTVPEGFIRALEIALTQFGGVRQICTVMRTSTGEPLPYPTCNDTSNEGELVQENVGQNTDGTDIAFGSVVFQSYEYSSKFVRVSHQLLRDSAFNIPSLLGRLLGERLGRITNRHFTTGDAAAKPKGFVPAATVGKTAASATAIAADEILEFIHSVDPAYRQNAKFQMHDQVFLKVSLLKDADNNYLLQEGLKEGAPHRLRGFPVHINQHMASTLATAAKVMAFGDFAKYLIREVGTLRLQKAMERFIEFGQVAFLGFMSCDGNLVDAGTHPVKVYQLA